MLACNTDTVIDACAKEKDATDFLTCLWIKHDTD